MKARHVLQVGMLALGLVLAAANGAMADHGSYSVGGVCSDQFNAVHSAIDASTRDKTSMKRKLSGAVAKLNKGKDAVQKPVDIITKVDGLLADTKKQKIARQARRNSRTRSLPRSLASALNRRSRVRFSFPG
jgi:hypothetical protein